MLTTEYAYVKNIALLNKKKNIYYTNNLHKILYHCFLFTVLTKPKYK